jgi:cell division protease FtsH
MFDEMTAALGGRASEKLVFDKVSTGALNDLEKVTKQAYAIVSYFGLNDKIGNISFYDSTGQREYNFTKPYSEKTAETIDEEVRKMAEDAYKRALEILGANKDKLIQLANKLLEEEVIYSDDVKKIFGERPYIKEERVPAFTRNKKKLKDVEAEIANKKDKDKDSDEDKSDLSEKSDKSDNE